MLHSGVAFGVQGFRESQNCVLLRQLQGPYQIILLRTSPPCLDRDTLGLGTPGRLWGSALQGDSGHSEKGWGTPGKLALGHSGIGHSRETLGLEALALGGHSGLGTLQLGTPGTLWVGHSREILGHSRGRRWAWHSGDTLGWQLRETPGLGAPERVWGWAL